MLERPWDGHNTEILGLEMNSWHFSQLSQLLMAMFWKVPFNTTRKDSYTALAVMLCHHSSVLLFKNFVPGKPVEIEISLCYKGSFAPKHPAIMSTFLMYFSIMLCLFMTVKINRIF